MKIEYLRKLADVIVNVDEGKGIDDSSIVICLIECSV